ncbi:YkvA family protein [Pusillimonas sp.]|uniref:YkvA family protein n=1 Tax=Pusillimonas sp. TaxID=3040095 RepID=UPI0037C7F7D0
MAQSQYRHFYSTTRFWKKLAKHAAAAGRGTLEKALYLYYAAQNPGTPVWAKRVIYGALGYFIFPLDAIPDLAPIIGYTDDLSVMAAALATVAFYVTPEVKAQAHDKLDRWFGVRADAGPQQVRS